MIGYQVYGIHLKTLKDLEMPLNLCGAVSTVLCYAAQLFRSIDSESCLGFPQGNEASYERGLVSRESSEGPPNPPVSVSQLPCLGRRIKPPQSHDQAPLDVPPCGWLLRLMRRGSCARRLSVRHSLC